MLLFFTKLGRFLVIYYVPIEEWGFLECIFKIKYIYNASLFPVLNVANLKFVSLFLLFFKKSSKLSRIKNSQGKDCDI